MATDSSVVDYEILLVDNASSDGSLQHVKRRYANHPKIRLVPLDQNYGFGPAFMKGLELASPDAEYLAFSNIDLFVDPGWLNEIIKVFSLDPRIAIVSPVICNYDSQSTIQIAGSYLLNRYILPLRIRYSANDDYSKFLREHPESYPAFGPMGPLFVCETDSFRRIGGFDPVFVLYGEEFDIGLRMWITGKRIMIAPNARAYHKFGFSSVPARRFTYLFHRNMVRSMLKSVPTRDLLLVIPLGWMSLFAHAVGQALLLRDPVIIGNHVKALLWNLRNVRDTIAYRGRLSSTTMKHLLPVVRPDLIRGVHSLLR